LLEIDVQPQFEERMGIALGWILWCVVHAMFGLMVDIDLTLNGVPVRHTLVNPSWHLTPVTPSVLPRAFRASGSHGRRGSVLGR
jgi:hypothetical protein